MSSISSVGANSATYPPVTRPAAASKPATPPAPATSDRDHDGDSDGGGVDVKG